MKAFFVSYNQALTDRVNRMLDEHGVRGFTRWALTEGRGSYDGEPHYGTHAWPSMNSSILAIVEDEKVPVLLEALREIRLRRGMLLQADPTVKFAIGDFTIRRVLNRHLEVDSPYNTYKYAGLPPSPICMPSIKGIDAVLNYKESNYLYFCAKEDFSGYHNFARTLSEHNQNARRYANALNRAGIR